MKTRQEMSAGSNTSSRPLCCLCYSSIVQSNLGHWFYPFCAWAMFRSSAVSSACLAVFYFLTFSRKCGDIVFPVAVSWRTRCLNLQLFLTPEFVPRREHSVTTHINVRRSSCRVSVIFVCFWQNLERWQISVKIPNMKFDENLLFWE
jgi:hypothetical protein